MSVNDQYALNWSNHTSHIRKAFDTLLSENQFVDVTLSCEGKKVVAHKIILSACSTYFHDLFRDNPCQHPIVILKDVKFQNLIDILKFIYNGEVSVSSDNFDSFLKTAELLQISGLTDDDSKQLDEASSAIESNETPSLETTSINLKSTPQPSQSTSTSITHQVKSPPVTKKRPMEVPQSEEPATILKKKRESSSGLDIEIKEEISESNFEDDELNSIIDIKDPLQLEQQQEEPDLSESLPIAQQSYPEVKDLLINVNLKSEITFIKHEMKRIKAHLVKHSKIVENNFGKSFAYLENITSMMKCKSGNTTTFNIQKYPTEEINVVPKCVEILLAKNIFPLSTPDAVSEFDEDIRNNNNFKDAVVNQFLSIWSINSVDSASKVGYRLVDAIFTSEVLTKYSWTGVSRSKIRGQKVSFNVFKGILTVFFEILYKFDNRYTMQKLEVFFKDQVLKQALKRHVRKCSKTSKGITDHDDFESFAEQLENVIDESDGDNPNELVSELTGI